MSGRIIPLIRVPWKIRKHLINDDLRFCDCYLNGCGREPTSHLILLKIEGPTFRGIYLCEGCGDKFDGLPWWFSELK